jgi:hypothetical protein
MPFSLFRERNIVTTKALFDFFDTMNDWNTVAMNLIWARRNINEYQFWNLMTLLVTHNRHFDNLVLPSAFEVFPTQFFTADVIDQVTNVRFNLDRNVRGNKLIVMSNYTTGVLGSNDDDDNGNVYDLNDIKTKMTKINDWNTLKKVVDDIKNQDRKVRNNQMVTRKNKDIKTRIQNNRRNLNQGNKFDNNGEDRMVYFTEDIGLNNYYYFSRMANSRIVDNKQMYDNVNTKENINMHKGKLIDRKELDDKINRRGERYLYQMKQLLARFNLERKSNGLDNVQDITLDGVVDNGVFANLRYTNGLQMPNRQNEFHLKKQHNTKLIQITKDFENRFLRAIDQGYVETETGHKVDLRTHNGINILGNLLQGNRNSVNIQYYRYLEYYYRLLLGGNNNDNVDFDDKRFVPTVLDHHETSMRDSVFWQMMKRITTIVNKFKNKLTGYKVEDVDFDGVKINNVKVDKLMTTFNYFDSDLTNGITLDVDNKMCRRNGGRNSDESDSNESNDSGRRNGSSDSDSDSNESDSDSNSNESNDSRRGDDKMRRGDNKNRRGDDKIRRGDDKIRRNGDKNRRDSKSDSGSDSDSNSNESKSDEFKGRRNGKYNKNMNKDNKFNYRNGDRKINRNTNSRQVNYYNRIDKDMDTFNLNILGRTRRLDTKQFTVTMDVDSRRTQNGIVRIFLGPRINNKQQLNDNRQNFVEIDQFIVKLNQGQNLIKRNSRDFKNVVGEPETMEVLYRRALNTIDKKNGNGLDTLNIDTDNNNRGFPHRLVLPKGTVGGEDYTLFVIVSDLKNHFDQISYRDNLNTFNQNRLNGRDNRDSNESDRSNDSNDFNRSSGSDSDSNESGNMENRWNQLNRGGDRKDFNRNLLNRGGDRMDRNGDRMGRNGDRMDRNGDRMGRNGDRMDRNGDRMDRNDNNGRGNWEKTNGVMIHNFNNQNKNCGNGNGVLDTRAMGFPLDRQINDVNGFITKNMFFKDVTVYHIDNTNTNTNDY